MILKKEKEDFLVEEILDEEIISKEPSNYHLYNLKKTNYTTERAIQHIAKALHIPRKFISYAGAKDKNAITKQHIVIKGANKEKISKLKLKDLELNFISYAKKHLQLGNLKGNKFHIVIRNLKEDETLKETKNPQSLIVPNYFDEQRFSTKNVDIGLAILKKEFSKAVDILSEDKDSSSMNEWLKKHENDFVGALQKMPKKILLFFIHSVQSKLFNDLLSEEIKLYCEKTNNKIKIINYSQGKLIFPTQKFHEENEEKYFLEKEISLIGFNNDLTENEKLILKKNNIEQNDFINKQLPSLSIEGGNRKAFFLVTECVIEKAEDDDLFEDKKKQLVSFTLNKGSYATIVLKQLYD